MKITKRPRGRPRKTHDPALGVIYIRDGSRAVYARLKAWARRHRCSLGHAFTIVVDAGLTTVPASPAQAGPASAEPPPAQAPPETRQEAPASASGSE